MGWTIEKVRELPEDNWLGIKRVGLHAWQIGGDTHGGMIMYTGDGGVVEYCNTFNEVMKEEHKKYKGVLDQINDQKEYTNLNLTYENLKGVIEEALFKREDGMGDK
jgi:hypothetical protein